ncbi:hypothetical protein [Fusobacterium sp.]|uniref:hypothetical protein n=1 Tax=Fusobacterium sp. TaxID=68766 RepID=UPI00261541BF|nr:hypothetical protein [Fusobacterium sp.]
MPLRSEGIIFEDLDNLVKGQEKTIYINENVALGDNLDPNNLWELMLFSEYLIQITTMKTIPIKRIVLPSKLNIGLEIIMFIPSNS